MHRFLPFFLLIACDAGHLGNPLTLPIRAIASGAENAAYARDRDHVKSWIAKHETAMRTEGFDGPVTRALLASLPVKSREKVREELKDAARHGDFVERATVIVMVHRS